MILVESTLRLEQRSAFSDELYPSFPVCDTRDGILTFEQELGQLMPILVLKRKGNPLMYKDNELQRYKIEDVDAYRSLDHYKQEKA